MKHNKGTNKSKQKMLFQYLSYAMLIFHSSNGKTRFFLGFSSCVIEANQDMQGRSHGSVAATLHVNKHQFNYLNLLKDILKLVTLSCIGSFVKYVCSVHKVPTVPMYVHIRFQPSLSPSPQYERTDIVFKGDMAKMYFVKYYQKKSHKQCYKIKKTHVFL